MLVLSPRTVVSNYVVRLNLPDGSFEQISGCDSTDADRSVRAASAVARWLHGGVLYSGPIPARGLSEVFDLRRSLRRRKINRHDVIVESVAIVVGPGGVECEEVVWPPPGPRQRDPINVDTDLEPTALEPTSVMHYRVEVYDPR